MQDQITPISVRGRYLWRNEDRVSTVETYLTPRPRELTACSLLSKGRFTRTTIFEQSRLWSGRRTGNTLVSPRRTRLPMTSSRCSAAASPCSRSLASIPCSSVRRCSPSLMSRITDTRIAGFTDTIDNTKSHDVAMDMLAKAGIYVIAVSPTPPLDQPSPALSAASIHAMCLFI